MPTPKNFAAMLEDLLRAQKSKDNERQCEILDMFLASSAITMEFVVNSGGKVVKALRGSQDEAVRKRAVELTAQWKALVAGKLATKVVVKKGDKNSEDEAGAAGRGGAASPRPAAAGASASKFTPPGQLARPREGVVLKGGKVLNQRVRGLNCDASKVTPPQGQPVVYWMSRDQRVQDNWAMLFAQQCALEADAPMAVCFSLVDEYLGAGLRQFGFMLRGLKEVEEECISLGIPFFLLRGHAQDTIPGFVKEHKVGLVVTDYSPIRITRTWRDGVAEKVKPVAVLEVDAHNIVPVWVASDKLEVGARTIRPRITKQLPTYLTPFPPIEPHKVKWTGKVHDKVDWEAALQSLKLDGSVPEVTWATPGSKAGLHNLEVFLAQRIGKFGSKRNDPTEDACSDMSPWLHFGQVSAQRCVLEAQAKAQKSYKEAVDSFVEEIVVRRELSDNFCHYQPQYDTLEGCAKWARDSLELHAADKRNYVYSLKQLENAQTHDELWNAAQKEMVHRGKMHGFMRMYWAKKILEWTASPRDALQYAIFLNDKYNLDGRDPNGFVGCMWSIGGVHDMGWKERPIFGKVRYMNYEGCKRNLQAR